MENEIKNFEHELMSQVGALIEGTQSPDGFRQFILSELKALKEEILKEKGIHYDYYLFVNDINKAFAKRGI